MASSSQVLTYDDLEFHEKLGDGGFGTVHRATLKKPVRGITEVAVKNVLELREEEVTIQEKLHHPHVVKLFGFIKKNPFQLIVLEYAPNGTVHDYIKKSGNKPVADDLLLKWLKESALALQYLHKQKVIHRDIKGSNCLLFNNNLLKLSDFGLAREIDESMTTSTAKGTWRYMAPEVNISHHFSFWSDVYAYGMLGLSMVSGKEPFDGMEWQTVTFQVAENKLKPEVPSNCPRAIAAILQQCWEFKPRDRPTASFIIDTLLTFTAQQEECQTLQEEEEPEEEHTAGASTTTDDVPSALHEDQLEVALPALRGRNTLIIMPTGAGKTVVASSIIEKVVNDAEDKGNCKVIFMVPTGPLVKQHTDTLNERLRPKLNFKIVGLKGAIMENSLKKELKTYNVVVLTAALLLTALQERDETVELESLALFVFDECHHCTGDHVYNVIMRHYLCKKFENPGYKLPQVVALTATPGTGKASSQFEADDHVLRLCANLDVQHISVVERYKDRFQERINIPEAVYPICVAGRTEDPFKTKVWSIMSDIEKIIKRSPVAPTLLQLQINPTNKNNQLRLIPRNKNSQQYMSWLSNMDRKSREHVKDGDQLRIIRTCVDHLKRYHVALGINAEVRTVDAYNYLDNRYAEISDLEHLQSYDKNHRVLLQMFCYNRESFKVMSTDHRCDNPLLKTLEEVIVKEYTWKPHSKAILICRKVETTKALKMWIEETETLQFLKPDRMVGGLHMTTTQHKDILERFKEGKHNLLVATNVIEEGLDVAKCNLVIRLNYVPSDAGHVQVKGRARAKNSRSYLIASSECNYEAWEKANMDRVDMSERALDSLRGMSPEDYQRVIVAKQREDYIVHKQKEQAARSVRPKHSEEFKLLCGRCREYACSTSNIGIYNKSYHIILLPRFLEEKAKISPHPKPRVLHYEIKRTDRLHCKKCNFSWGMVAKICHQKVPVIRISGFTVERENSNGTKVTYANLQKWTEAEKIFPIHILEKEELEMLNIPDLQ